MTGPDDAEDPEPDDVPGGSGTPPAFDRHMLEALICPQTYDTLVYDADRQELISRAAHLAFPIRNGIPIMLVDEARLLD
jgi:hypothetical protein